MLTMVLGVDAPLEELELAPELELELVARAPLELPPEGVPLDELPPCDPLLDEPPAPELELPVPDTLAS
ncbi:MAG TPA: hypothetical protein VNZ06_10020 [Steroidobacteraceae bacterium]|nr:hypothetical protein [Steroidobacteraceae bacterium]